MPHPTSTKAISQHIHQQKHMGEKTESIHVPAICTCVGREGEGVTIRGVSVPQLVKSGFHIHILTEIRTRTRKRQMHTALGAPRYWYTLYCIYILRLYDLYKIYKSIVHIIIKYQL